jgi:hypothetical protein
VKLQRHEHKSFDGATITSLLVSVAILVAAFVIRYLGQS